MSATGIVTAHDGTRYRRTGIVERGLFTEGTEGEIQEMPTEHDAYSPLLCIASFCWERLERLPHIPDWPLPCPAPQYLADHTSKAEVQAGDTILVVTTDSYNNPCVTMLEPLVESGLLENVEDYLDWGGRLGTQDDDVEDEHSTIQQEYGHDARVYLISRKDSGEDA